MKIFTGVELKLTIAEATEVLKAINNKNWAQAHGPGTDSVAGRLHQAINVAAAVQAELGTKTLADKLNHEAAYLVEIPHEKWGTDLPVYSAKGRPLREELGITETGSDNGYLYAGTKTELAYYNPSQSRWVQGPPPLT